MRRPRSSLLLATVALLGACAGPERAPALATWLRDAPEGQTTQLWLVDARIARAVVPLGPGEVPRAARERVEQAAPGGSVTFQGREWGPFGTGFRIDKRYDESQPALLRSALVSAEGMLLDFGQTAPLTQVPRAVLDAALSFGREVRACWLFAEPGREPRWECSVQDGLGRVLVVTIDTNGRVRSTSREVGARLRV